MTTATTMTMATTMMATCGWAEEAMKQPDTTPQRPELESWRKSGAAGHIWMQRMMTITMTMTTMTMTMTIMTMHDDHDDHDEHHDEEEVLMEMFNMSDVDGNQLLDMTELMAFMELVEEFEEDYVEMTPGTVMEHFDANNDSNISWDEFWNGWIIEDNDDDGHDDHDDHDGHDDHDDHDDHDEHHDEEEFLMEMFNMSDGW